MGCESYDSRPLGRWLTEGTSRYLAYEVLFKSQSWDRTAIIDWRLDRSRATGQLSRPLRDFEGDDVQTSSKSVGYLAVTLLVRSVPTGASSLRTLCEEVGAGSPLPEAFETAFGFGLDDFYDAFEKYRERLRRPGEKFIQVPTPASGPIEIKFEVSEGVPANDLQDIQTGIGYARSFIDDELGGDIASEFQGGSITVKVLADGSSHEWAGSMDDRTRLIQPYFDVKHDSWQRSLSKRKIKIAAHEYTHAWLASLRCLLGTYIGSWTNEGIAEYVAFQTLIRNGHVNPVEVHPLIVDRAIRSDASNVPLDSLEEHGGIGPGNIGYLAVESLIARSELRLLSIRAVCEEFARGSSIDDAFEAAFGITRTAFYKEFEAYRKGLNLTAEPTSIPEPGPSSINFDIAPNVPERQEQIIKTGLRIAQDFLDSHLGGGIPEDARSEVTVKIVATGRGNEESGGGVCCTATRWISGVTTMRPFFDVAHPAWKSRTEFGTRDANNRKIAVHEYAHNWQEHLGCLSGRSRPRVLDAWMIEGSAEFIAYEAMIEDGEWSREEVTELIIRRTRDLDSPLRDLPNRLASYVGLAAVHRLVQSAPNSILSLRTLCEEVGDGAFVPEAFETAFGVSLDDFYADFEKYRKELSAG